ncbi:translational machinery component [Marasmius fiardii PR-910]|nr:translational machinery component [Marasmius fiardii PR-910]
MFGLQAWRSSLRSIYRRPSMVACFSQRSKTLPGKNTVGDATNAMLDDLEGRELDQELETEILESTVEGEEAQSGPPVGGQYPKGITPQPTTPATSYERPRYRLHCHSTRNNTITTFTRPDGGTIAWFSGGSCGFKRGTRSSYEAGYQCSVRVFQKIKEIRSAVGPMYVELFFKGFGQGREALQKALSTSEGDGVRQMVITVTDRTPIKIGGTRSKKARRL